MTDRKVGVGQREGHPVWVVMLMAVQCSQQFTVLFTMHSSLEIQTLIAHKHTHLH